MDHSTGSFVARGGVTIFTRSWRPAATRRGKQFNSMVHEHVDAFTARLAGRLRHRGR